MLSEKFRHERRSRATGGHPRRGREAKRSALDGHSELGITKAMICERSELMDIFDQRMSFPQERPDILQDLI
jgi:hypothetical protein